MENPQHVSDKKDQQDTADPYAPSSPVTPAAIAVVSATAAKQEQQNNNQYQHHDPSFSNDIREARGRPKRPTSPARGILPNARKRLPFEQRWPGVLENTLSASGGRLRILELRGLADAYREIGASLGRHFFDAGTVTPASLVDGVHLDEVVAGISSGHRAAEG
jgi:hypothetical protein